MNSTIKIGFGGGCHWCTEAVFQSLKGVLKVDQGWIKSIENPNFSEAVIVHFNPVVIPMHVLIEIHLRTHSSTSNHSMRKKYRSAIYTYSDNQYESAKEILLNKQNLFDQKLITLVDHFDQFKMNEETYLNYFTKNPEKPFCRNRIDPKLSKLRAIYSQYTK